ncbi:hypothetical protein ZIOFF_064524 [Zingiber officinale]|uniref:NB-ARC domain-containing protein n=2 Tax=Zingiber officinale TaxID=94328 RepID=A0A8J5KA79_ZINOF|nr:hypothetical protein ZIOFF_064524 [Zingiber officinale]
MMYFSGISQALGCLKDCTSDSCNYVVSYEDNLSSLAGEVSQLKSKSEDVKREVEATMRQGLTTRNEVLGWLRAVEGVAGEADQIRAKYERMIKCFCRFPANICTSVKLRRRAEAALASARELKQRDLPEVVHRHNLVRFIRMQNQQTAGVEKAFEELRRHARDDGVTCIGIHGMGGVGKSALLREFNNYLENELEYLDIIIFLESSTEHKVEELHKFLFARLNLTWQNGVSQMDRAANIFRVLSHLKFVLIVDNLWEPLDYRAVGIPFPEPESRCKIIVASRIEDVCSHMRMERMIRMERIEEEAAWELFRFNARLEPNDADERIIRIAKVMARKCGGLPAALVVVAQTMANKKTVQEWMHAVNLMRDAPFQLPGMEERVLYPLKLSYDRLLTDRDRLCASYFSLVPEGCLVDNYFIRKLWIGEGIIDDFNNVWESANETHYLLGMLSSSSLIQRIDGKSYASEKPIESDRFKMHPMTRAMILWVGRACGKKGSKWLAHYGDGLAEAPTAEKWRVAERVALGQNKIRALPEAPQAPDLIYLDLGYNDLLVKIPNGFFSRMPKLKILDLQDNPIEDFPVGICNLALLQFLTLSGTKITSLPRELGALVNLRYLACSSTTRLKRIPDQLMSRLQELRWLKMCDGYNQWRAAPSEEEEAYLEELEVLTKLKVLGIAISTETSLRRLFESQRLTTSVHWLQVEDCRGLTRLDIPSTEFPQESMPNIMELRVHAMNELEEFAIQGTALANLMELHLSHLPKASLVCRAVGCLGSLRTLRIENCKEIARLIQLDAGTNDGEEIAIFPALKRIVLKRLPKFESFSDESRTLTFSSLESIEIEECPKLTRINLCCGKLKSVRSERAWWDELEWEDDLTKLSFENLFKPL